MEAQRSRDGYARPNLEKNPVQLPSIPFPHAEPGLAIVGHAAALRPAALHHIMPSRPRATRAVRLPSSPPKQRTLEGQTNNNASKDAKPVHQEEPSVEQANRGSAAAHFLERQVTTSHGTGSPPMPVAADGEISVPAAAEGEKARGDRDKTLGNGTHNGTEPSGLASDSSDVVSAQEAVEPASESQLEGNTAAETLEIDTPGPERALDMNEVPPPLPLTSADASESPTEQEGPQESQDPSNHLGVPAHDDVQSGDRPIVESETVAPEIAAVSDSIAPPSDAVAPPSADIAAPEPDLVSATAGASGLESQAHASASLHTSIPEEGRKGPDPGNEEEHSEQTNVTLEGPSELEAAASTADIVHSTEST